MSTPPSPINSGDTAWILASTALVFIMIPGLGYFYSGMVEAKHSLSMIFLPLICIAIVSLEWVVWGFSLAYSTTGGSFIGNFHNVLFLNVGNTPYPTAPTIPANVFAIYQCTFAAITPALIFGATAERLKILPAMLFIFIWSTVVYNPIAYWVWSSNGWLNKMGYLDFAGGTPVHICSGFSALAYSYALKRRNKPVDHVEPHSRFKIALGTALLWFGWFGFNAGSALAANARAGSAAIVTNTAGAVAGLTWVVFAWFLDRQPPNVFNFCSGAIAGLAAITPASGFVAPWASIIFGVAAGIICRLAISFKNFLMNHRNPYVSKFAYDDVLDVVAVHGISGLLGNILNGIFAQSSIAALDGQTSIPGGAIDGHGIQVAIHLLASAAGIAWSFVITYLILFTMDSLAQAVPSLGPLLSIRFNDGHPMETPKGTDRAEMDESEYDSLIKDIAEHEHIVNASRNKANGFEPESHDGSVQMIALN